MSTKTNKKTIFSTVSPSVSLLLSIPICYLFLAFQAQSSLATETDALLSPINDAELGKVSQIQLPERVPLQEIVIVPHLLQKVDPKPAASKMLWIALYLAYVSPDRETAEAYRDITLQKAREANLRINNEQDLAADLFSKAWEATTEGNWQPTEQDTRSYEDLTSQQQIEFDLANIQTIAGLLRFTGTQINGLQDIIPILQQRISKYKLDSDTYYSQLVQIQETSKITRESWCMRFIKHRLFIGTTSLLTGCLGGGLLAHFFWK
jgi:hypothetical protein